MYSYTNKAMDFLVGIGLLKNSIEKLRQNAARGRSGILGKSSNVFDGGLKSMFLQMLNEDWIIRVTNFTHRLKTDCQIHFERGNVQKHLFDTFI